MTQPTPKSLDIKWDGGATMTLNDAFAKGFQDATNGGRLQTYRHVSAAFPHFTEAQIEMYQNGWEDGKAGDDFRLRGLFPQDA